ncbi:MAG: TonB-dependent receptor plug domain-containing protein, partial [Longimicrobiales bacterium]
ACAAAPDGTPGPPSRGAAVADTATGAVATVEGDALPGTHVTRVEELFAGRFAGVRVFRTPSGGISVRIRGVSSFDGGREPLYVVDGMPVTVTPDRGLDWLNPADILRIEILKDASATSLYGMRGANGVVLITTRRGSSRRRRRGGLRHERGPAGGSAGRCASAARASERGGIPR